MGGEQRELEISNSCELVMVLILRIHEMLNLSHGELSHSEKTLLRVDFVPEAKTNLSSSEWHSAIVEVNQSSEVNEDTLSSLRPEKASLGASRANLGLEH